MVSEALDSPKDNATRLAGDAFVARLPHKRERRADDGDDERANRACPRGIFGIRGARGGDSDDETTSEDGRDPSRMLAEIWSPEASGPGRRLIAFDADDAGAIEAEPDAGRISLRVAEEVCVGGSGEEAVDERTIVVADDDCLAVVKAFQTIPCRVVRWNRSVRQRLRP